jgi:hypothetical protein
MGPFCGVLAILPVLATVILMGRQSRKSANGS